MDEKTRQRQNASRAARVARGERQVAVWLSADAAAALDRLCALNASATVAINEALVVFDANVRETAEREQRIFLGINP